MKYTIVFAIILFILAGCSQNNVVKIGYIGPLSGPSAVLGMDAIKAIEIAADEAKSQGIDVQVIAEDDQYMTSKTVTAYNKLVNVDDVDVLLVSTYGGLFAIADQARADGVVVVDVLDCNDEIGVLPDPVFCVATHTESIGYVLADYANNNGMTKVAVLYGTKDRFMGLVKEAFKARFAGTLLEESYAPDADDFKTVLTKFKEENVDAIGLFGYDETGLAMKQARELGINAQFFATGTVTSPSLQQASAGAVQGTVFGYWESSADNPNGAEFERKFQTLVGRPPILPLTTHPAYDAARLVIAASQQGSLVSGLYKTNKFEGAVGTVSMDSDGTIKIPERAFKLENGKPVPIS
ncbi:MAG TPA: ABC transporter substrate-binding protein [Candidatus Nanoarchaeia archaeon]|nr:ABC transporter substrate-binding protein [Candidatus Woesearchaeota archaeon]HLC32761.1 ABC transporter substrate-binding protein [Candidatus Nanoarchaeia archaeon]